MTTMNPVSLLAAAACAALVGGCAAYSGASLRAGVSTEAEARQLMGEPALVLANPDGSRELAYPKGPLGSRTYMVEVGGDGKVRAVRQALDDDTFNAIQPGMTEDEVLRLIGPPRETWRFARLGHHAWDYRYNDAWGYPAIFSVTFDSSGRVVSKISQRLDRSDSPSH
jgi:hypothetical protein